MEQEQFHKGYRGTRRHCNHKMAGSENLLLLLSHKSCPTLCDPTDYSPLGSSVHGIFQEEYWSRLPFPSPGDHPHSGIELISPALAGRFFAEPPGKSSENLFHAYSTPDKTEKRW